MRGSWIIAVVAVATASHAAQWSLHEHLDRVLVYEGRYFREYSYTPKDCRGPRSGRFMWSAFPAEHGGLRPYAKGMEVRGELREGQMLIAGLSMWTPTIVEFVVSHGKQLQLDYGLCDRAVEVGNTGTRLTIELHAHGEVSSQTVVIKDNQWSAKSIALPPGDQVLVRLVAIRRNSMMCNWTGIVLKGDGALAAREAARKLSPNRQRIGRTEFTHKPSPHRVAARPGYDILFYRGRPWWSFAVKGFPSGSHEQQAKVGVNTYYVEGMTFARYWPEGADGVVVPKDATLFDDIHLCQQFDMPFKCPLSLAHCSPFLPAWLVAKENLGLEGHKLRRGGATHTSFIKPATMRFHKRGIEGWIKPFLDQAALFVFSQEDDASLWDDYSADAAASWRAWLRRRFRNEFDAFGKYVGGVQGFDGFDAAPQPKRFEPDERFGYPMRLAYLKLLWITESYGDYLAEMFAHVRKLAPGVPLTQRYVNWANGLYVSRRVKADYSYTFGHLTTEGVPNSYGIGKKCWTGIYTHFGSLPLPRGGSIGKTYSRKIRRGEMAEHEWRLNAYTLLANGCCGTEYSTLTPSWGEAWHQAALYDLDLQLTPTGQAGQRVMKDVLGLAKYMMHYEHHPDVAVFHDASFNTGRFAGPWGQSKVGLYTLIRETGFHADRLTEWDMTADRLSGRKVLVLGGTLSIAPEIQDAIRAYVRGGGMLVALFCSDGRGFPGCNSYAYGCKPRDSAARRSFEDPRAEAHLGDVLGIEEGGGVASHEEVRSEHRGVVSLRGFNALVAEGRWVAQQACCAKLKPAKGARVVAVFEDGSPAVIEQAYGRGRAVTFGVDLGLIANNLTVPGVYNWWSDLLGSLGCRKAVDTGNPYVEGGAWHDDSGSRLTILVNHDADQAQTATLSDGKKVQLAAGEARTFVATR